MTWLVWVGLVLCFLAVAAVGLSAYGAKRWTESMRILTSRLDASRVDEKTRPGAGVGKDMVMLPWEGRWSDYRARDGMTVPFTGEVAWVRPAGRQKYFHGSVTTLTYDW